MNTNYIHKSATERSVDIFAVPTFINDVDRWNTHTSRAAPRPERREFPGSVRLLLRDSDTSFRTCREENGTRGR